MGSRRVFSTLDGLRGLAALAVVTRHVPDPTLLHYSQGSTLAVDLFFGLSGFVLAHSYAEKLEHGMGILEFMRVRITRLYPLYILGTILVALHMAAQGEFRDAIAPLFFGALFLPTPPQLSPDIHPFPLNFPAWSLFFELLINLAYAVVAPRLTNRLLTAIILVGLPILVGTGIYYGDLTPGSTFNNFAGGGGRVIYSFFIGVAMYRLWLAGKLPAIGLPAPACLAVLALIFIAEPKDYRAIYDLAAVIVVFPLLVLAAARHEPTGSFLKICEYLGVASYAIYVMQVPVIRWAITLTKRATHHELKEFGIWGTIGILVTVAVLAVVLDRYFDKEARSRLNRALRRKPA